MVSDSVCVKLAVQPGWRDVGGKLGKRPFHSTKGLHFILSKTGSLRNFKPRNNNVAALWKIDWSRVDIESRKAN